MTATRDDILAELRLAPRWVLRRTQGPALAQNVAVAGVADGPPPAEAPPAEVAAPGVPMQDAGPADARRARIATLAWGDLPADIAKLHRLQAVRDAPQDGVPGMGDPGADWLFVGEAPVRRRMRAASLSWARRDACSTTCWWRWASRARGRSSSPTS